MTEQHQHEPIDRDSLLWEQHYDFTRRELEALCGNDKVVGANCYDERGNYIAMMAWSDDRQKAKPAAAPGVGRQVNPLDYATESEIELAFETWVSP